MVGIRGGALDKFGLAGHFYPARIENLSSEPRHSWAGAYANLGYWPNAMICFGLDRYDNGNGRG